MAMSKGCTVALIIVAVLVVILIVGIILIYVNRDKILNAGIDALVDSTTQEINKNLPEGYTEAYVFDLMNELKTKLKDGSIPADRIQQLAQTFQAAMNDNAIDVEESQTLLEDIQSLLGKESPMIENEEILDTLSIEPAGVY